MLLLNIWQALARVPFSISSFHQHLHLVQFGGTNANELGISPFGEVRVGSAAENGDQNRRRSWSEKMQNRSK